MQRIAWVRWLREIFVGNLVLLFLLLTACCVVRAEDVPAHRAARLSYLQGNVTVESMDNTGGDPAQVNMPLTEGERVTTGEDGQAEVEFEDGSVVRMTPNSALALNALSVDSAGNFRTQLTVLHGLIYAELRAAAKFTYSVDADGELVSPVENTTVRLNLDQSPAVISVLDGTAHVEHASSPEADGYRTDVRASETLTGDPADSSRYFLSPGIAQDSWDEWNQGRDQAAAEAAASRTAARDGFAGDQGYGWSDLDANGSWYNVPGQGQVWQPTVAQDESFDPYGYGSWVSYPGTGYVWASGYGWGWTPFRCGNWSYWESFGWGWSPGAGCGLAGWGFSGGVYVINVVRPPLNYRLPTRPVHPPGIWHPVPVGRAVHEQVALARGTQQGPRSIAGVPVEPLKPVGAPIAKGGGAAGAALRSDFAVDGSSHQPLLGVTAKVPAAGYRGDSRPAGSRAEIPAAAVGGVEPANKPMRPPPPQSTQRSGYSAQGDRSVPRSPAPAYTPRSAPPQPAPRAAPPAAPAAVPRSSPR